MSGKRKTDLSGEQDKNGRSGLPDGKRRTRRQKSRFISDAYTRTEVISAPGSYVPSWAAEAGRRLEVIAVQLGKDISVQLSGKSWKQLQRYFEGHETPAGVIRNFAMASNTTTEYILDGNIITSADSDAERRIIDRKLIVVREQIAGTDVVAAVQRLRDLEARLLDRSTYLSQIGAALLGRPKRLKTLEEFADPASASTGEIDEGALKRLRDALGVPSVHEALPREPAPLDVDLLARIWTEIGEVYRQENARICPQQQAELQARFYANLVAAHDAPADRLVGLRTLLQDLRRQLREAPAADGSSKRLA